jgi:hypothetical protein
MKKVEVEWTDTCNHSGWRSKKDVCAYRVVRCFTLGYLVCKDDKALVVAQSLNQLSEFTEVMVIPLGCVRKIKKLT